MKTKKGFTLIEILSIIVVLGVIAILVLPNIGNDINDKKQKEYDEIIGIIENAGKVYLSSRTDESFVTVDTLINENYLTSNLINPITNESITGTVLLQINDNMKNYIFSNESIINLLVDLDGGVISSNPEGTYFTEQRLELPTPTKEGVVFSHWSVESGNSVLSGNNLIMGTSNTTIKAIWAIEVELLVNLNGGIIPSNIAGTYMSNQEIVLPIPTRAGVVFSHWSVESGNSAISGNTLTMGTTETTIKANWNSSDYTIVYDCNGGSGSTASSSHTLETGTPLTANGCYKMDATKVYYFMGWCTNPNGAGKTFTDQEIITTAPSASDTTTLYALWGELFTASGNFQLIPEANGNWVLKIKGATGSTYGTATITFNVNTKIDLFLVGGGSGGGPANSNFGCFGGGGGAGGGRTTVYGLDVALNYYEAYVGAGGSSNAAGQASTAFGKTSSGGSTSGGGGGAYVEGLVQAVAPAGKGGNGALAFGTSTIDNTYYGAGGGGGTCKNSQYVYSSAHGGYSAGGGTTGGGAGNGGNATANTGSGGGGGYENGAGGSGGSGIIIIRNAR